MPLFELDGGMLIPAQFGRTVNAGFNPEIMEIIRDQVLEIIGRPLFPINWDEQATQPRLTALDPSGQVVSVEVLELLDSTTIIESLSRLAETANMGWNELADAYSGGVQSFRYGWAEFRNMMPPSPAPGPRLILVATEITDSVRPVLDVLATSGVEVHELTLREMSNGRRFIEVQAVGPRLYGHNPNLLLQGTGQLSLPGTDSPVTDNPASLETVPQSVSTNETTETHSFTAATEPGKARPRRLRRSRVLTQTSDLRVSEETITETPAFLTDPKPAVETLSEDATGLYAIAQIVGTEIELVWKFTEVERFYARLKPEGVIVIDTFTTDDPNWAVKYTGAIADYDGWEIWRLGSDSGPTLREALAEINAELIANATPQHYRAKRARN